MELSTLTVGIAVLTAFALLALLEHLGIIDQRTAILGGIVVSGLSAIRSIFSQNGEGPSTETKQQPTEDPRDKPVDEYQSDTDDIQTPEQINREVQNENAVEQADNDSLRDTLLDAGGRHSDSGSNGSGSG